MATHNLWLVTTDVVEPATQYARERTAKVAHLVGTYPTYDAALAAYEPLYRALREGRLYRVHKSSYGNPIGAIDALPVSDADYLAVRDATDPGWQPTNEPVRYQSGRRIGDPVRLLVAEKASRGSRDYAPVVRRWAKRHGYEGREGGWVYDAKGRIVVQGWFAFADRIMPGGTLLYSEPTRTYRLIENA